MRLHRRIKFTKRAIVLTLSGVALVLLAGLFFVFQQRGAIFTLADTGAPALILEPSSGTKTLNANFDVNIRLDTAGLATAGVQIAYLNYNPAVLQVVDADASAPGVQIAKGNISNFEIPIANNVNETSGKISYAVGTISNDYTGNGILAKVTFKALTNIVGTTVAFDFDGSKFKTMVGEPGTGNNILASVSNGLYDISSPSPAPAPPAVDLKVDGSNGPVAKKFGESATLSWDSANADSCTASNGWSGAKTTSGSASTGPLSSSTVYVLSCVRGESASQDSVQVNVSASATGSTASPTASSSNSSTTKSTSPTSSQTTGKKSSATNSVTAPLANIGSAVKDKTTEAYKGSTLKPWAFWFLFGFIPLFLVFSSVYFFIKHRRQSNQSVQTPNYPF